MSSSLGTLWEHCHRGMILDHSIEVPAERETGNEIFSF